MKKIIIGLLSLAVMVSSSPYLIYASGDMSALSGEELYSENQELINPAVRYADIIEECSDIYRKLSKETCYYTSFAHKQRQSFAYNVVVGVTDQFIECGTEASKETCQEILINLFALLDNKVETQAVLSELYETKQVEDYVYDAVNVATDFLSIYTNVSENISESEKLIVDAIGYVNKAENATSDINGSLQHLEKLLQDYDRYMAILNALERNAQGNLKEAAVEMKTCLDYSLEIRLSEYKNIAEENIGTSLLSDVTFEIAKNTQKYKKSEVFKTFIDQASAIVSDIFTVADSFNTGVQIGKFVGNLLGNGEDMVALSLRIQALDQIATALNIEIQGRYTSGIHNIENLLSDEKIDTTQNKIYEYLYLHKALAYVHMQGEYCMYQIVKNEPAILQVFENTGQNEYEEWYKTRISFLETIIDRTNLAAQDVSSVTHIVKSCNKISELTALPYIGGQSFATPLRMQEGHISMRGVDIEGILGCLQMDFDNDGRDEILSVTYENSENYGEEIKCVRVSMYEAQEDTWAVSDMIELAQYNQGGLFEDLTTMFQSSTPGFEGNLFLRKANGQYQLFYEYSRDARYFASGMEWYLKGYTYDGMKFIVMEETTNLQFVGSDIEIDCLFNLDPAPLLEYGYGQEVIRMIEQYKDLGFQATRIGEDYSGEFYSTVSQDPNCYSLVRLIRGENSDLATVNEWLGNPVSELSGFWIDIEDNTSSIKELTEYTYTESTVSTGTTNDITSDTYILPDSNTTYYTEEQISNMGLTVEQLCLARNEIFARHGRRFSTPEIQEYFDSQSWYVPQYAPEEFDAMSENIFNDCELSNIAVLKALETKLGSPWVTGGASTAQTPEGLQAVEAAAAELEKTLYEDGSVTQADLNNAAASLYHLWDDELNRLWGELKNNLDSETMDTLTQEQLSWIEYKENEMNNAAGEGSMAPMNYGVKGAALTKQRVYELMEYLS